MGKQRIYKRPKTRDDMFRLFEQVFYEVRHWYACGNAIKGLSKHIRDTFKKRPSDLTAEDLEKANSLTLDEWMQFAKDKYFQHLERESARMKEKREEQPIINTTVEEILPCFENEPKTDPVQLSLDYDKARIADALETIVMELRSIGAALREMDFRPVKTRLPKWRQQSPDA